MLDFGAVLKDDSEQRFDDILTNHGEEARQRVSSLLALTQTDANGCMTFGCKTPRKVRFNGYRIKVYRFVYCVLNNLSPPKEVVIRHQCANNLCVNPQHLEAGTQSENWQDHLAHRANGIDFRLL